MACSSSGTGFSSATIDASVNSAMPISVSRVGVDVATESTAPAATGTEIATTAIR